MPDDWGEWDDWGFEADDLLDHADLDVEEDELEAALEDADGDDWGPNGWGLDDDPGEWGLDDETDEPETDGTTGGWAPGTEVGEWSSHAAGPMAAPAAVEATGRAEQAAAGRGDDLLTARTVQVEQGRGMTWSAWDVGAVFALGGWLLDQHAAQIGAEVRQALTEAGSLRSPEGRLRGAPHPAPPSGHRYGSEAGTLEVGGPLLPGLVYAETRAASAAGRGLLVQAEGSSPAGGRLVLVVSVVPSTGGPQLWVVAEERPDGFSAARLLPVFQRDPSGGLAIFATDDPGELADAVVWACARENVAPELLDVVRRA
jgi:hypothetical protein